MSVDLLHEKIRKLKNPVMVNLSADLGKFPHHLLEQEQTLAAAYVRFCRELLEGLKGVVPAVRFSYSSFALLGEQALSVLSGLLKDASKMGFYVLLDAPQILSGLDADFTAEVLFGGEDYPCDGLLVSPYIGTDGLKPFLPYCKEKAKDLFVVVRSANKSASELQDLLTGTRLVHGAAMDLVNRSGETLYGKCGYSRVAAVVSAGSASSLRTLRGNYNRVFLMVDGLDYPSGNAKNCAQAFDRFGYGAVVCAGTFLTAAWIEAESDGTDYVEQAVLAAERLKRNLGRYVTIM